MRWWKSMRLWKDMLYKVTALFGKLQEAWLSQENILAQWQFPLYNSSARNLLCLYNDNLQELHTFFSLLGVFAGGEPNVLVKREWISLWIPLWSKVCRESRFSKVNWKTGSILEFLSRFTCVFITVTTKSPFFSLVICWELALVYVSMGLFRNDSICHQTYFFLTFLGSISFMWVTPLELWWDKRGYFINNELKGRHQKQNRVRYIFVGKNERGDRRLS